MDRGECPVPCDTNVKIVRETIEHLRPLALGWALDLEPHALNGGCRVHGRGSVAFACRRSGQQGAKSCACWIQYKWHGEDP